MNDEKPQTEQDRLAEESIQQLLAPELGEAIADAADGQYLSYAPLLGSEGHHRGVQLGRVVYEFLVGGPTKLISYWRQGWGCLSDHPEEHKVFGNLAMLVFTPVLLMVSLPLGIGYFLRAAWTAVFDGVIKRQLTFVPKSEHRERLTRKS